ncbi:MgtC/SapB family protein [Sphingomonas sp. LB-2]|uniref:MgtC/SapB family protein n=1 Tax=Sphingomonas caeni TaxID=2984949 RepID=UPI00222E781E|nr:MgtC/SapB family protein [Sphingomonas caeni]MCW3848435.1 MgtC/SapB family protein [Sphingomonas caeni]
MLEIDPTLRALAAALAIGLLIGLERGWRQRELADGARVSGFRTFALIGLAGGIAALLPPLLAAIVGAGVAASLVLGYASMLRRQASLSATTTVMAFLTFALGYLAASGMIVQAFAAAGVALIVLVSRGRLHGLLKGMSEAEVESVARFALVALVILPLLPDADFGPYGAWNPRRLWMVVVILLGFSFAGYVAARRFGAERGILVTAIFGAFVSSTAVTLSYARRLRESSGAEGALVAGIALASLVMFVRVQVLAALLAPFASWSLAITMLPALTAALLMAGLALRRARGERAAEEVKLGNPMDFRPALLLAGLLAILSVVARWALERFGQQGIAVLLGLTGMLDVDASVVTLAGLPEGAIDGWTAGVVLSIPILANTLIKALLALFGAGGRKGLAASAPLFAAVLASVAGIALASWLG